MQTIEKTEQVKKLDCRLGNIEYTDNAVTTFPNGLFGFEHLRKFLFIEDDRENAIFNYLQSIDEPDLVFILVQPSLVVENYELVVKKEEIGKIYQQEQTVDFAIVTIPEDKKKTSINLLGPIFINFEKGLGIQVISENENYTTKHFINEEIEKKLKTKKVV